VTTSATSPALRTGTAAGQSPFIGLEPYGEEDAPFFFGRERETRLITANLRGAPLTVLYGASGVGKSSALQAGVVHELRQRVKANAARDDRRFAEAAGASVPFAIAYFNLWRDESPLERLMERVRAAASEALGGAEIPQWPAGSSVSEALSLWNESVRSLMVVLDQFEEYFLYHPEEQGDGTFATEFPRIVNDRMLRVQVLLSIREDAVTKLDRFKEEVPAVLANRLKLGYLDREAARRAIEGPIDVYNELAGDEAPRVSIEPTLIEAVLDGVKTGAGSVADAEAEPDEPSHSVASGSEHIETPFMQLVMDRLWEAMREDGSSELTEEMLSRLGGPQQIVRSHLERVMSELSEEEQAIAADAFRFLVTSDRTKVAQSASDIAFWTKRPEEDVISVLDHLSSGRRGRILRPLAPPHG
jgi:hypothetical protein